MDAVVGPMGPLVIHALHTLTAHRIMSPQPHPTRDFPVRPQVMLTLITWSRWYLPAFTTMSPLSPLLLINILRGDTLTLFQNLIPH